MEDAVSWVLCTAELLLAVCIKTEAKLSLLFSLWWQYFILRKGRVDLQELSLCPLKQAFSGHASLGDKQEGQFPEAQLNFSSPADLAEATSDSSEKSTQLLAKGVSLPPAFLSCTCTVFVVSSPSFHQSFGGMKSTLYGIWPHYILHSPQPWQFQWFHHLQIHKCQSGGPVLKKNREKSIWGCVSTPQRRGKALRSAYNHDALLVISDFPIICFINSLLLPISSRAWVGSGSKIPSKICYLWGRAILAFL